MNSSYFNLQTRNRTYGYPEPNPIECDDTQPSTGGPLQIPCPSSDHIPRVQRCLYVALLITHMRGLLIVLTEGGLWMSREVFKKY